MADIKRVHERIVGDPRFRDLIAQAPETLDAAFRDLGVTIAPREIEPLLGEVSPGFRASASGLPSGAWPLVDLWARGQVARGDWLAAAGSSSRFPIAHRGAAAWRDRQLHRLRSEVGPFRDYHTTSPLFAFELSKGCSVGCWFCGVSAARFSGYVPYTEESRRLWRGLLGVNHELFGAGSGNAILYYATDPFDNLDYDRFLDDFHEITGVLPQTTTAVPFKQPALTKTVMERREQHPDLPDRFSVLSAAGLEKIHRSFSPYALRYTELVLMNPGAFVPKSSAGRAVQHPGRLARENQPVLAFHRDAGGRHPQTIGCVVGFLVNVAEQTVRLTAPCNTSADHPDGMRVIARNAFRDAQEYRDVLLEIADTHMTVALPAVAALRFRDDLSYQPLDDGFAVTSGYLRHTVKGEAWYRAFGDLLVSGRMDRRALEIELSCRGVPLTSVSAAVDRLYEHGLLDGSRERSL